MADLAEVTRLIAQMDENEAPMPLARAERILRVMARYPDYRCYLVFEGVQAVGTFTLLVFDALAHGGAREALVDGVVVTPARRGQGIGRWMLGEAMRIARESGCYKLALSSNNKRVDAHRFYESLGFERHGVSFAIKPAN
jgi:GNAT superfamily N-acetyltransferase